MLQFLAKRRRNANDRDKGEVKIVSDTREIPEKKAYESPRLEKYGTVTDLTQSGVKGGSGDGVTRESVTPG